LIDRLKRFFQGMFIPAAEEPAPAPGSSEVDQIAALQKAASQRRAEYAALSEKALREQDPLTKTGVESMLDDAMTSGPLMTSRKRMEEADSAHIAALQKWENKQSRQKCY